MIPLPPPAILVLFVSIPLIFTAILALFYSTRSLHRSTSSKESIYECGDCGYVYAFARNRPMDRCPRCGHLNDALGR
jgi:hypothetical protein